MAVISRSYWQKLILNEYVEVHGILWEIRQLWSLLATTVNILDALWHVYYVMPVTRIACNKHINQKALIKDEEDKDVLGTLLTNAIMNSK